MKTDRISAVLFTIFIPVLVLAATANDGRLPAFGLDTVLVWNIRNRDLSSEFVIRIAEFLPDRFLEWEDAETQGTIFMSSGDIQNAPGYVNSRLFKPGVDARAKNVTTMWLSRKIFRDLKTRKKVKIKLDGVPGRMTFIGSDQITLEVNRSEMTLPVIKTQDDRGSERWFLDQEGNPLMVRHMIGEYDKRLVSITTDRPNTLRWIKGKKLQHIYE